jgi:hypothetical protein
MSLDKKILEEVKRFNLMSGYSPKRTLTENLNEQENNVQKIANELGMGARGPLGVGAGTVLSRIINAIDKIKDGAEFNKISSEMAKNPRGGYTSIIKLLQGEIDGADVMSIQKIKNSLNKKGINLIYKSKEGSGLVDPNSIQIQVTGQQKIADQSKVNFIPEKFPLKYMMQGENVKKLQQALDVRNKAGQPNITGKFYNATQLALDKKASELKLNYNRKVGLDQESFNKIVNPANQNTEVKLDTAATKGTVLPG